MRLIILLALAACTGTTETPPEIPVATDRPNPLNPEVWLLPWPSDLYLAPDESTATGWRVQIDQALLPDNFVPEMFSGADGFSRVNPIVAWLPGSFDAASLPNRDDWGATLSDDSGIWLVREDTLERVPAMVELDSLADEQRKTLLIRAHRTLDPDTRYAVIVRDSITAADGSVHTPNEALTALLQRTPEQGPAIEAQRPGFELVHAALQDAGVSTSEVIMAWTFRTRSEGNVIDRAVATQQHAATAPMGEWSVELIEESEDRWVFSGSVTVPRYLDDTDRIALDDSGAPIVHGTMEAPVFITIPRSVDETRPTMLFGHGFFSSPEESTWGNLFDGLERWRMPAVTTEFFGFSEGTLTDAIPIIGGRFVDLDTIIDKQLQSHCNFTMVHRLISEELADDLEVLGDNGSFKPLSSTEIPYMGISNGGTQGLVMMTTSPVLDRGGLVVAGGGWSHMLQRASQWATLGAAVASQYPDPRVLQLVMAQLQLIFDPVDSLNYTDHLIRDRLPGTPADPDLLLIEAVGDAQVANLVTRWVAGNAGFNLLAPSVAEVWGVDEVAAGPDGLDDNAGYVIYDLGLPPLPEGNVPPEENGAHNDVRLLDAYREQMGIFLETGRIQQTCDGTCDPE